MRNSRIFVSLIFITCCLPMSCDVDIDGLHVRLKSYDFNEVEIGDSVYFELEVENFSAETRRILEIRIISARDNEYWVEGSNSLISILGKSKKYLNMWFAPTMEGENTAIVQIITDDEKTFNIEIKGIGVGTPEFHLPYSLYDFDVWYTGHIRTNTFTIENLGTGTLIINGIDISGEDKIDYYTNNIYFPVIVKPKLGGYPEDYTFDFDVNFKPIFTGQSNAKLIIDYGEYNDEWVIELTGEACTPAADINVSTYDYNYGTVDVGDCSQHVFYIENTGVKDLSIHKLEIAAVNSADFVINEVKKSTGRKLMAPYATTLAGGHSLTVLVDFKPIIRGYTHLANLKILHSLSSNSSEISLRGDSGISVVINECQTSDMPCNHGDWIELRNRGGATVDVSGWTIECWQSNNLEITYRFAQGSKIDGYQQILADDYSMIGNSLPHFYIGANLLWNRGGVYPGDYEVLLRDDKGYIVDYVCFGNRYVATPDHRPSGTMWPSTDFVNLEGGKHYIYRTSDQNNFNSQDWATGYGEGTPLQKNPGQ